MSLSHTGDGFRPGHSMKARSSKYQFIKLTALLLQLQNKRERVWFRGPQSSTGALQLTDTFLALSAHRPLPTQLSKSEKSAAQMEEQQFPSINNKSLNI